jgi:hypothetical protein
MVTLLFFVDEGPAKASPPRLSNNEFAYPIQKKFPLLITSLRQDVRPGTGIAESTLPSDGEWKMPEAALCHLRSSVLVFLLRLVLSQPLG